MNASKVTAESGLLLVQTTVETAAQADRLANELVNHRLAACVSIGAAIQSVYPWQGRVERAVELPVLIKTCPERLNELKARLSEWHPYEVPELLVISVIDGSAAYIDWARQWMLK